MLVAGLVIGASFFLSISRIEKIIVFLICGTILTLELLNTGVEKLLDKINSHYDKDIGVIKDIMAGVVLFASGIAVTVGIVIFWPPLSALL